MLSIRRFLLGSILALSTAQMPAMAEALPPIKQVVSFGDSLTDAGTFWFRFTTNPGYTWAQHLALHYGQAPLPNQHIISYEQVYKGIAGQPGPGGLNYAQGGARVNSAYSQVSQAPEGTPISATMQLQHYLKEHQRFKPDQLVTLYIGTNDVAYDYDLGNSPTLAKQLRANQMPSTQVMREQTLRVEIAAQDTAALTRQILDQGAKRLLVFKLVDMGHLPWFRSAASQRFASALSAAFNRKLIASLPKDPSLLIIDPQRFINETLGNPSRFGITHGAHEDACRDDDQDYCYPTTLKSMDADQTYLFAAGEHMTTRANALLAQYVLTQLNASALK